ncbi:MAG: putative transcriptional regulator containing the CopG/Arc/MetJ DNA-binding domain and a [Verrucomicrobiales bacterium]|nr:putative transcriptional regulator containing the CopG/Arc/MetJ DNA-binding domain and a [Verrucomicrobiales bacterium]
MRHDAAMRSKKPSHSVKAIPSGTRITVTFPSDDYAELLRLASAKRVSASWIVRDAVEKYLTGDIPLFANANGRKL